MVLEWEAPAGCPERAQVQGWLDRALADSAADPAGMRARAMVRAADDGSGLVLELVLERPGAPVGRRTMQAGDCHELAKAAVLIVALAEDPEAEVDEPIEPTVPEQPEPPEPVEPEPPEPSEPTVPEQPEPALAESPTPTDTAPEPAPSPERRPQIEAGLRAQAAAGISVLPSTTAVVSLVGALWGPHWRAELGASYWTPVTSRPDGISGGRIEQWTLDARGCGLLRPGPLELPLCAGLDVGAVHGRGRGVTEPRRVASLRLAAAAGPALLWRPTRLHRRLGLWLGADLLVALVRARFRATPAAPGLVYHTPPVGARVGAGIELRFR